MLGLSPSDFRLSNAHCCFAPSIWRRLFRIEMDTAFDLALDKLGSSIPASSNIPTKQAARVRIKETLLWGWRLNSLGLTVLKWASSFSRRLASSCIGAAGIAAGPGSAAFDPACGRDFKFEISGAGAAAVSRTRAVVRLRR